jgi:hypothetical protein
MGRSAGTRRGFVPLVAALLTGTTAAGQEPEPDLEFLEYLGSFEAEDEAWYVDVQVERSKTDARRGAGENVQADAAAEQDDE